MAAAAEITVRAFGPVCDERLHAVEDRAHHRIGVRRNRPFLKMISVTLEAAHGSGVAVFLLETLQIGAVGLICFGFVLGEGRRLGTQQ
tara:strand:- start:110 stop:373 length:264 start_codon:yes stop_codon:yes gene_type:complete